MDGVTDTISGADHLLEVAGANIVARAGATPGPSPWNARYEYDVPSLIEYVGRWAKLSKAGLVNEPAGAETVEDSTGTRLVILKPAAL